MYFAKDVPPDLTLRTQSMKQPWPTEWQGTFDLVHQRLALPAAGRTEVKETLANMTRLLKPGGWLQLVEADHSVVQGPAMQSVFQLICDMFNAMDTGTDYAPQLEVWFQELGLVNTGCRVFDVPLGANSPNDEMKTKSTRNFFLGTKAMVLAAQCRCVGGLVTQEGLC